MKANHNHFEIGSTGDFLFRGGVRSLVFFCLLSFALTACLRYTPSRSELEDDGAISQYTIAGDERELWAYETKLDKRLEEFIASRKHLLNKSRDTSYRFGRGDLVGVSIYRFPDLTSKVEVAGDGSGDFPLVGKVAVAGKSVSELREDLTQRYRRYIKKPLITVDKKEVSAHKVFVVGEVARPGSYNLQYDGQLLTELLAEAGGRTDQAGSRVIITADQSLTGSESAGGVEIDLEDLLGSVDSAPLLVPLLDGDRVVVPKIGKFQVDGEVERPGEHVLNAKTSVLGAIAASGGLTFSANVEEVEVIREIGKGKKAVVGLNLEEVAIGKADDIPLRDGDVVRVPSEPGRFARRQVIEFFNGIFRGINVSR